MSKYQAPRGTRDIGPEEGWIWRYLENRFFALAGLHGYNEIRTPMFEDTELFVRTSGDTSDIVTKEMYTFRDRKDRELTLKPEGTAPSVRAYLEHQWAVPGLPTRLAYCTDVFRYERPQKGRYRHSHQFGLELLGSASPLADVEVIALTAEYYQSVGVGDVTVLLNSIGRSATRAEFKMRFLAHMEPYVATLDEAEKAKFDKNPLRLLDSKDDKAKAALVGAPNIQDCLEDASREHFEAVKSGLNHRGINYRVATEVVRGLDYYTDTVFEIHSENLGSQAALCGGGRYDNLVHEIGGPATPAVGVGMGIERLVYVLDVLDRLPKPPIHSYFVAGIEAAEPEMLTLVSQLREAGHRVQMALDTCSIKAQYKMADRFGATTLLVLNQDELANNTLLVKDLTSGESQIVSRAEWMKQQCQ